MILGATLEVNSHERCKKELHRSRCSRHRAVCSYLGSISLPSFYPSIIRRPPGSTAVRHETRFPEGSVPVPFPPRGDASGHSHPRRSSRLARAPLTMRKCCPRAQYLSFSRRRSFPLRNNIRGAGIIVRAPVLPRASRPGIWHFRGDTLEFKGRRSRFAFAATLAHSSGGFAVG
jgi:hypothetical protein